MNIHDNKLDNNSVYPIVELLNIDMPTEPSTNRGLALEAIFKSLSQVERSIKFFSYNSQAYFAPRGYPQSMLIINTKLQLTGSLRGLQRSLPITLEYMYTPS